MKTLSELFETWSDEWVKQQQTRFIPLVERVIREEMDLPADMEIVWENLSSTQTKIGENDE